MSAVQENVPLEKKYELTIKEASEYFNIGINKLYEITDDSLNDCILRVGNHKLKKRGKFAERLDKSFVL